MRSTIAGLLLVALILCSVEAAQATPVTISFSGDVDLTAYGASATSTFLGTVTWESTTFPFASGLGTADYAFTSATLSVNSTDYSADIQVAPSSFVKIYNDIAGSDSVSLVLQFSPFLNVGVAAPDIRIFNMDIYGPQTVLSSTALPADTTFLTGLPNLFMSFRDGAFGNNANATNKVVQAVPEPASLLLLGFGLAAVAAMRFQGGRVGGRV